MRAARSAPGPTSPRCGARRTRRRAWPCSAEEALAAFPKPTLAAIRGYCVGGGCQLAAACDLRFAEEGALFGVTPAKLGIVYPASSTRRLVSLVGPATAKYLLFSGELIDAERALRTGSRGRGAARGRTRQAGRGVHARSSAARSLLTQAAAKEFANGRTDRDAYWARAGARQRRHRGGGRRVPGAPAAALHLDPRALRQAEAAVRAELARRGARAPSAGDPAS